jgi:uncharacterized protein YbjT (DUF2867 family)
MSIFVAGGTGYLGRPLLERLVAMGRDVRALARPESVGKLPPGVQVVVGDALDSRTYRHGVPRGGTFVHLVGVAHPSPAKSRQFQTVDWVALREAVDAAVEARAGHFVFVSVAHPAPVMRSYQRVRIACEHLIRERGLPATILRPWYVLGPGHRWPVLLQPVYALAERVPAWRESAHRLALVTHSQMVAALVQAVTHPSPGTIWEPAAIRQAAVSAEWELPVEA